MAFPYFKFILSHDVEGTLEIKEPEGWDDGILKLERNKDFHSLVEGYDQPLVYDDAEASDLITGNVLPGGMAWLKNIEETWGVGAIVTQEILISTDGGANYRRIFIGLIALDTAKEIDFYKVEYGMTRNDFWSKFISQKTKPVDLMSPVDLQGNTRVMIDPISLPLPSQKVRQMYYGENSMDTSITYSGVANGNYGQIDFEVEELSEISTKYNYPLVENNSLPAELFALVYGGTYLKDIVIYSQVGTILSDPTSANLHVKLQINDDSPITLTKTNVGTPGLDGSTRHTYTGSLDLVKGDFVRIYFENNTGGSYSWSIPGGVLGRTSYLRITADTVYDDTETDAFLFRDALESCLSRITGADNVIQSNYFDACGEPLAIAKGVHYRGYTFDEKPFTATADDLWNIINPMANLGLSYVDGEDKIEIEKKEEFYDSNTSINLDFVNMIERSVDTESIFKSIEIGYEESLSETYSGIDDTQTKTIYNTEYPTVGKEERILSKGVLASMAIEETRRKSKEANKDWRLDDKYLLVALSPGSPEWTPELSENFASIGNLLNPNFRYNIRWSVAHNYARWQNYINGGLQKPSGQYVKFGSGEGNKDMITQLESTDCEYSIMPGLIDEGGNFPVTNNFLYTPKKYTFEHPLTIDQYETIRNNRKKAIGVSRTDEGHESCFIVNLEFKPTHAIGTFEVLVKGLAPIPVYIESDTGLLVATGFAPSISLTINITPNLGQGLFNGLSPTLYIGPPL